MKRKKNLYQVIILSFLFVACEQSKKEYDASGSFEAIERTISAEATGKIVTLNIEEGQLLKAGEEIGRIDVTNLSLQSEQVKASIEAINQKTNDPNAQITILQSQLKTQQGQTAVLRQQLSNLNKEINRFENLVNANAVPRKQLDDLINEKLVLQKQLNAIETQLNVIKTQIEATKTDVTIQNRAILSEIEPNQKRLAIIQKQIQDGIIVNEYDGTITSKIAYDGEYTTIGRPLYRIADLSNIILRVYVSGNQLSQIQLNQEVIVRTDDGNGGLKETKGIITWISSKAEFTPKTIQTKDERANLVYAVKVKVQNDGSYKIGMYGEIKFQ